MANELIQAGVAIEETAKATGKGIDAVTQGGQYAGWVLGDLPRDLVGIMGDWVKHKRARRWSGLCAETEKILVSRGITNREDISPSVAIPLIAAAINEDRDILKQMWANLLANAMDPNRANLVRASLIDLLKQFDPLDALVLREVVGETIKSVGPNTTMAELVSKALKAPVDEIQLSLEHLIELGCVQAGHLTRPIATTKGRLLLRAVGD